ncbi:hypothetical protein Hanom_Chr05g00437111 [Helianthus anomalus]
MVLKLGYTDLYQTPEPLYEAIGKQVTMQVQYACSTTPNSSVLSVNKVYDNTLNITVTPLSPTQTNNTYCRQKVGPRIK